MDDNELQHHGVLGMKWGKRKARETSGSTTRAEKKAAKEAHKNDPNRLATRKERKAAAKEINKANRKEVKALMKADRKWYRERNKTIKSVTEKAMSSPSIEKVRTEAFKKHLEGKLQTSSRLNNYQREVMAEVNNQLSKDSRSYSPSGRQIIQMREYPQALGGNLYRPEVFSISYKRIK